MDTGVYDYIPYMTRCNNSNNYILCFVNMLHRYTEITNISQKQTRLWKGKIASCIYIYIYRILYVMTRQLFMTIIYVMTRIVVIYENYSCIARYILIYAIWRGYVIIYVMTRIAVKIKSHKYRQGYGIIASYIYRIYVMTRQSCIIIYAMTRMLLYTRIIRA